MNQLLTFVLLYVQIFHTRGANILGYFPTYSKSHHSINQPIMKGLAARGHNVTIISHYKSNSNASNYTEIIFEEIFASFSDSITIENTKDLYGLRWYLIDRNEMEKTVCQKLFATEYIKNLINSKENILHLIIAEVQHKRCCQMLAYKLNVPLIVVSPPSTMPGLDYLTGNPHHPGYVPFLLSTHTMNMNFIERLRNTVYYLIIYWYHFYVFGENEEQYAKDLNMELPSDEELNRKTALVFHNNHFSFMSRPRSPNVIDIAGIHIEKPKKLSQDIEEFISGATHGAIFFSFGSAIKASSIPFDKLEIIKQVFASIPQRVLWRVDELNITDFPDNVKLSKWFPQRDILEYKNVIAFISHCGLLGTLEAIHTATPVVGIPLAFDQFQNAKILAEKEVGILVDFHSMDKITFLEAIKEIISNKTYNKNMKKLSQVFKDRPMRPIDEAIYWSEYVLKHRGAPRLRIQAADMPLYQYLLLDIIVTVMVMVLVGLYLLIKRFRSIVRLVRLMIIKFRVC